MFLHKFSDGECEIRTDGRCYFVLPAGEIGRMSAGVVEVRPGGANDSCAHTAWRQVFFILEGKGTLIIDGDKSYPIESGMVCEIPFDAEHRVVASGAGPVRYLYVNDYSQPTLRDKDGAAAFYKGIESEVHADLAKGGAKMLKARTRHSAR